MSERHSSHFSGVVGNNVRKLRKENGWIMKDLCARMAEQGFPLDETHLSYIERSADMAAAGRRVTLVDADKLMAFSKAFNVPISYFFQE